MEKISTFIVDDEKDKVDFLKSQLQKYPMLTVVGVALDRNTAIKKILTLQPQLLFLDVQLVQGTGFDILEAVKTVNMKVIFVTAYDKYALKAFQYNAIDYLLKPFDDEDLNKAINKATSNISEQFYTQTRQIESLRESLLESMQSPKAEFDFIAIPTEESILFVKLAHIVYLKSDGGYTEFHLDKKKSILSSRSIGEYESILSSVIFFRIHKSYVINLNKVHKIDRSSGNYCEMVDGSLLPIARRRQELLRRVLSLKK